MSRTTALVLKAFLGTVLFLTVILAVYFGVSFYSEANKMAEMINIGNTCMEAEEYEAAISAYDLALEYEPENEDIRKAISTAYVILGDNMGDLDTAAEYYREAKNYSSHNKNAYLGLARIYEEKNQEDDLLDVLREGLENTGDAEMQSRVDSIMEERARIQAEEEARLLAEAEAREIEEKYSDLMSKLYDCFSDGKFDDIKKIIREETYISLSDEVIGDKSYYFGEKDDAGKRSGKGLGVYSDGFYYFGDYADDVRSGNGIWIRAAYSESDAIGSFVYEGQWENDKPNGTGTSTTAYYQARVGQDGLVKQVITGNYSDGFENGEMELNGSKKSGGSVKYTYTCDMGVPKRLEGTNEEADGRYIIAQSKKGKLTSDGSSRGVEGFLQ